LVCVENTNKGGGACYEIEDLQKKFASLITWSSTWMVPESGMP
jgi:hypothetical protein